ncbi:MAG TPA: DEAD/DEAH box helicase [Casimicrobiaceae bacterium]|jgi:ATP-dependent Lhr-like helicase|nr:DEAD/DEAH box helicase [Casimicrobiaceae bacterium]
MKKTASFHPAVDSWFRKHFAAPTEPQARAWPEIQAGRNVLVAAPTGSGKTLAAFLAAIDSLVRRGVEEPLPDETLVVYVSPLKALSNDIQKNLSVPLAGIREELKALDLPDVEIRTLVRTGDTPQAERVGMRKRPPHIVVTTPESLYVLLGSESGRKMLATTRTVIVDEIHALAGNKRGSHLALSLERLAALSTRPPARIGLSATQKPIEEIACFLVGERKSKTSGKRDCIIVDAGHIRERDLAIEVPSSPLEAVMSNEVWQQVYGRLAELALTHRTTLIFVNTRRMAERAARHLSERLGAEHVTAHHGSMAKELRLKAEQRLKSGELKVLVATASLELGIDIGDVELVCQLGSPRSIATFLQRAGRASHQVGGVPKARIFPLSRDELVECTALLDAVRRGELDRLIIPPKPLDVLSQQIVAEVAAKDWPEDALFALLRRAYPYAKLTRDEYLDVVRMLAEGFSTRRGHRAAYVHRDAVNGVLRGRRGARLTALTSGGAIPDNADYDVVLEPAGQLVGTVNEDFAVESLAGDIFQLGNSSYRILRVEAGRVRVDDAHGQPPTIPFWLGEAPARTDELSHAVSRLREEISAQLTEDGDKQAAFERLVQDIGLSAPAAGQIVDYLAAGQAALGTLPTQKTIVFERFFDESGGMQLVIHSPFGSRINRAWGLALRKRFCTKFNFELQAAATEDSIVLSLSTSHSFPLESVARYLNSKTVRPILVQAMLDAPMFGARWRWIAGTSLALPRFQGGKKVPAPLQRMRAEDLMAAVFPDQIACAENLVGDREVPDHPLVQQAIHDCLYEAMDVEGLERLLADIESGKVAVIARDLTEPSPLALEILTARPYAYLDDAPLEERRAQAVMSRRWLDDASAADLGRLDAAAIERVRAEAWPDAGNADELHDALLGLGFVMQQEVDGQASWRGLLDALVTQRRATRALARGGSASPRTATNVVADERPMWVAAERLPQFHAVYPNIRLAPPIEAPAEFAERAWTREDALVEIVRSRLEGLGPTTTRAIAESMGLPAADIEAALAKLVAEGVVMSGLFTPGSGETEWCDRALLARIHRYTVKRLRQEIEPVSSKDFLRFLFRWQHVTPSEQRHGPDALDAIIAQLQGFEAPAAAWESEILPARLEDYEFTWLDDLCLSGRAIWTRLSHTANSSAASGRGPIRTTPVTLLPRRSAALWTRAAPAPAVKVDELSSRAQAVVEALRSHGASFYDEIVQTTGLLRTQVEDALAELVAAGLVASDSFAGLRALLTPSEKRKPLGKTKRHRRAPLFGIEEAGRWALVKRTPPGTAAKRAYYEPDHDMVEHIVHSLLRRYGVVFWRLLQREAAWLPAWRDMLRVLRRLEARGDIRGGRFIAGASGEQFALPEAVNMLRETRRAAVSGTLVSVSGADPLNLVGVIAPGAKVPALLNNRVLYRDGVAIATLVGGEIQWIESLGPAEARAAENALVKRQIGSPLLAYLR